MAIEITEFADVDISVSATGIAAGNFGILGFFSHDVGPLTVAERYRVYTSLKSVNVDWAGTETGKAAAAFYGQTPTPNDFVALAGFSTAQSATLVGGTHVQLEELQLITNGDITCEIDGSVETAASLNFTAAITLVDVAEAIETAFGSAAEVLYDGSKFVIQSLTTGLASTIVAATGDSASKLGLDQANGRAVNGILAESPVVALSACVEAGAEFVGLVLHKDMRDVISGSDGETTLEIAAWSAGAKKIFCNTTNSLATLQANSTGDIGYLLQGTTNRFVLTTFSRDKSQYPSAAVFGRAATVNFGATNSTITLNLKQLAGVSAEDLTPNEFANMRAKYVSAVVRIGKTNTAYTDSRMASGSWLDTTHGLMWLEDRAKTDLFNLLYTSPTKIPYTQTGINIVTSMLDSSLQAAVRNGLCGPGFLSDGTFLPDGYEITAVALRDVPVSDKGNRLYQGLSFVMVGAGALHEVQVSGTFSE
jgi:hypothetical protein